MTRSTRENARALLACAMTQGGYFTAKQARAIGYGYSHIDYHLSTGAFERIDHGLYRLTSVPPGEHDDLVRLALWSRDRQDRPQAVVSHASALVLHELTELLPNKIDLTVPPSFRKPSLPGCVLHKATLTPQEVEERVGYSVTKPLRTLVDVTRTGIPREQLEKALIEALRRGLVRKQTLTDLAKKDPNLEPIRRLLEKD